MTYLRLILLLIIPLGLAACGGLPHAGQVSAKATNVGLSAGTDPASGGLSAIIGYKGASLQYNPNSTGDGSEENPEQVLSGVYGTASDSRSFLHWDDASADVGSGASVALGGGVAGGPAAVMVACGLANAAAGTSSDCLAMFSAR